VADGSLDDVKFLAGGLRGATCYFAVLPLSWQTTSGLYAEPRHPPPRCCQRPLERGCSFSFTSISFHALLHSSLDTTGGSLRLRRGYGRSIASSVGRRRVRAHRSNPFRSPPPCITSLRPFGIRYHMTFLRGDGRRLPELLLIEPGTRAKAKMRSICQSTTRRPTAGRLRLPIEAVITKRDNCQFAVHLDIRGHGFGRCATAPGKEHFCPLARKSSRRPIPSRRNPSRTSFAEPTEGWVGRGPAK
jgi:hypothetical protein